MSARLPDIFWLPRGQGFAYRAAEQVAGMISHKPTAAIALPTGNTPLGMYTELVTRTAAERFSPAKARFFNLDDYVGLSAEHPLSYARFLRQRFLTPAGVPEAHIRLFRAEAHDLEAECRDYEAEIAACGGLDLAILGLGANGHIAFNEPGSDWSGRTHVVSLTPETRATHAAQTHSPFVIPRLGLTVGIATIMDAREILLLAAGDAKARALAAFRQGMPDPSWPVTALLTHRHVTVLAEAELQAAVLADSEHVIS
jgi:glucosamine-6-phosphate deaminase